MPQISSVFVHKMIDQAPPGCDRAELLAICGLNEARLADTWLQVAAPAYYAMMEQIAAAEGASPAFHIRAAAAMRCEDLGAVGLAFKVAPTLRDSLRRLGRYVQLVVRLQTFALDETGEGAVFRPLRPPAESAGAALSYEASFCTILTLAREATGASLTPARVRYAHAAAGDPAALRAHLGCPVEFSAENEAIEFAPGTLDRANRLADTGISAFFDSQLDRKMGELRHDLPLAEELSRWAANVFSDGPVTIAMAASAMGMSARTLQRRLAAEGRNFNTIVDEARKSLARRLLSDPRRTLADVAFLTGFSEQSTFNRAFRRWHGVTPGTFRDSGAGASGQ